MISMKTSLVMLRLGLTQAATAAVRLVISPMGINKKVIGLMKDELGGRVITKFMALRLRLYTYKMPGGSGDKK